MEALSPYTLRVIEMNYALHACRFKCCGESRAGSSKFNLPYAETRLRCKKGCTQKHIPQAKQSRRDCMSVESSSFCDQSRRDWMCKTSCLRLQIIYVDKKPNTLKEADRWFTRERLYQRSIPTGLLIRRSMFSTDIQSLPGLIRISTGSITSYSRRVPRGILEV